MVSSSRSFDIAENCEQITADAATIEVGAKITITESFFKPCSPTQEDHRPNCENSKLNRKVWDFLSNLEACFIDPFPEYGMELHRNEKKFHFKGESAELRIGETQKRNPNWVGTHLGIGELIENVGKS